MWHSIADPVLHYRDFMKRTTVGSKRDMGSISMCGVEGVQQGTGHSPSVGDLPAVDTSPIPNRPGLFLRAGRSDHLLGDSLGLRRLDLRRCVEELGQESDHGLAHLRHRLPVHRSGLTDGRGSKGSRPLRANLHPPAKTRRRARTRINDTRHTALDARREE